MAQSIDLQRNEVARGSVLRHAERLFEGAHLHFDPAHKARAGEIVVGEIDDPVTEGFVDPRVDGFDQFSRRDGELVFSRRALPRGLIAIPVGNRYALRCLMGGLQNPIDLEPNDDVLGGATIINLAAGCIGGFMNYRQPPGHPVTRIRVLGTVVESSGRPVSLRDFLEERESRRGPAPRGVLVAGAGMETGKTTFCTALFHALRDAGTDVRYLKATGTTCLLGDPLRVQTNGESVEGLEGELAFAPDELRVSDFVDACGVPSDLSVDFTAFASSLSRYLERQEGEVCIAELADSLHHRTNAGLVRSASFRSQFERLVYVTDASFDAAQNFVHFVRDVLGWSNARLAFSGPLATDPVHEALRAEVEARLAVPCLDPGDGERLRAWMAGG